MCHTPKVLAHDEDVRVAAMGGYYHIVVYRLSGLVRMPSILEIEPEVGLQSVIGDEGGWRLQERLRTFRIATVAARAVGQRVVAGRRGGGEQGQPHCPMHWSGVYLVGGSLFACGMRRIMSDALPRRSGLLGMPSVLLTASARGLQVQ